MALMSRLWKRLYNWWHYPKLTGRTVDFKRRGWGHNISGNAVWCSPRLEAGDVVVTELGRFLVVTAEPCYDPPDMVFATFKRLPL